MNTMLTVEDIHVFKNYKYLFKKTTVGEVVYCIGMKEIDGKFYCADKPLKIEPNLEIELHFKEISEKDLKKEINYLNN